MKIGKICELIPNVKRSVFIRGNTADICPSLSGDSLSLKWSVIRNGIVEYKLHIGRPCFVDRAVVTLGNKTAPVCVGISVDGVNTYNYRAETGKTVTDYILGERMQLAMHLLSTTKLQIQTVALHCGVVDVQYFSKTFKKATGLSPQAYRKERNESEVQ